MNEMTPENARALERFARHVGRGINRFAMIGSGDHVLIGVSGGEDSLALSLALAERKKWVAVRSPGFRRARGVAGIPDDRG